MTTSCAFPIRFNTSLMTRLSEKTASRMLSWGSLSRFANARSVPSFRISSLSTARRRTSKVPPRWTSRLSSRTSSVSCMVANKPKTKRKTRSSMIWCSASPGFRASSVHRSSNSEASSSKWMLWSTTATKRRISLPRWTKTRISKRFKKRSRSRCRSPKRRALYLISPTIATTTTFPLRKTKSARRKTTNRRENGPKSKNWKLSTMATRERNPTQTAFKAWSNPARRTSPANPPPNVCSPPSKAHSPRRSSTQAKILTVLSRLSRREPVICRVISKNDHLAKTSEREFDWL